MHAAWNKEKLLRAGLLEVKTIPLCREALEYSAQSCAQSLFIMVNGKYTAVQEQKGKRPRVWRNHVWLPYILSLPEGPTGSLLP